MSFGKLTITAESGEIEEVELARPTTSVGRQPGNDVVLPTSAVSRYHAQFDAAEGQVFLVDLGTVNGSFVNDEQVDANGRVALQDGDVIQLGDVRMIFASPRRGTGPLSLHTTEHIDTKMPVRLVLDDPHQPVAPGSFLQFALVIENLSGSEQAYTIDADGMEQDWIRVNRREVKLAQDEQTEVLISVRPPRASATRPGRYPLRVRVAYKDDLSMVVELLREVDVIVYAGIAMAMKPARQQGQYHLALQNQGNSPLGLELSGYQAQNLLRYQFTPSRFTVDAGQTQQVILRVTPNRPVPSGQRVPFAAVAHALDVSSYQAPLVGYYQDSARSAAAGWLDRLLSLPVLAVIGLVTVAVAAALLAVAGIIPLPPALMPGSPAEAQPVEITATPRPATQTPPPTAIPTPAVDLTAFDATPEEVVFGTVQQIVFSWEVDRPANVRSYFLHEDASEKAIPLSISAPSISRFEMDTATLVTNFGWGAHDYTLTITGVDGVVRSSTVSLTIAPVICEMRSGFQIYPQPGQTSGTPVPTPPSKEVIPGGRTEDGSSMYVWDVAEHRPLGWARSSGLSCPLTTTLNDYIVVTPLSLPITNTPSG